MIAYCYDGSFDGMLCCIFESFTRHETPDMIFPADQPQITLYPVRTIMTQTDQARRVENGIRKKISEESWDMVRDGFLCALPDKETVLVRFVKLLFRYGKRTAVNYANPTVDILWKALRHLYQEAHLLKGFVRFSDYEGVLVSVISPKNQALPILAEHFSARFPGERFMIYDQNHKIGFIHTERDRQFIEVESLTLPQAGAEELAFRTLWRNYFHHMAIKERENPVCQRTHLAFRYRPWMTEFQNDEKKAGNIPEGLLAEKTGISRQNLRNPVELNGQVCYPERKGKEAIP